MTARAAILHPTEVEALLRASSLPDAEKWRVTRCVHSHRRDPGFRQQFVVEAGDRAFLTVGRELADLVRRTKAFAEAYPSLAPRLLGVAESGDHLLMLQEYVDGSPLLTAFRSDEDRVNLALAELETLFASSLSYSSPEAALAELKQLDHDLLQLDLWRDTDREFLRDHVFPFLAARLISPAPKARMSNGDFISRNLLVQNDGRVCVIDHENAGLTHFYGEDWLRFGHWDNLPEPVREFVNARIGDRAAWTVYLAMRQMVLEARHNRRRPFLVDARRWCRDLKAALESDRSFRHQVPVWPQDALTPVFTVGVQLFWETTVSGWSEEASETIEVGRGQHTLVFSPPAQPAVKNLRLDPLDLPGTSCVQSITVRARETKTLLFHAAGADLRQLIVAGDAVATLLPNEGGLQVESAGNDPQLYLPPIVGDGQTGLDISVVLSVDDTSSHAR